ncbi:TonB-dependent receptor [Sphingobium sp. AP50]|uniref:TonB-dependent receptor n=1 Tax=Sphingobium sp. AP50 TaxID=1884369 RepID=UPI000B80F74F|nr:TonB-dependent receptor [Sphingobium sp. AP50]
MFGEPILTNKFTQEIRSSNQGSVAEWLAVVFYTHERTKLTQSIDRTGNAPNVTVFSGSSISSYAEKGAFADLTYHATEKFDGQGGIRYAAKGQYYRVLSVVDTPVQGVFGPGEDHLFTSKEDAIIWLLTPTYLYTHDLMPHLRGASGYRADGPNSNTPGVAPSFRSDTVMNYEAGIMGKLLAKASVF